ncbi:MAG: linear amide C-N hydrolase [Muribaculaceae bacterium]|nr:linear amide C-N hydrolase [Muribaculaceae bacterium]
MKIFPILAAAAITAAGINEAEACSRVVFLSDSTAKDEVVMVGRTLDWRTPIPTNLYVYPAGISKQSMPEGPMLRWTSRYGSVLAVGYDGGVTEGMNDRGLVMNSLFCKTAVYRQAEKGEQIPVVSLSMIVSYFLDNFATVNEVAEWLDKNEFAIAGQTFDGGTVSLLHFGLTDQTGETLLMEFVDGHLNTYRGRELTVLTNDPNYYDMKAIHKYWTNIGGTHMLPGTVTSPDRFVRADFFINHVPKNVDSDIAWAELSSVMANVAVPLGYELPGSPNVSSTQWRSISDSKGHKYYFKFTDSMGDFYIDMNELLLKPGAPILKLDTSDHSGYYGNVNKRLKKSDGFTPMW